MVKVTFVTLLLPLLVVEAVKVMSNGLSCRFTMLFLDRRKGVEEHGYISWKMLRGLVQR